MCVRASALIFYSARTQTLKAGDTARQMTNKLFNADYILKSCLSQHYAVHPLFFILLCLALRLADSILPGACGAES